MSEYFPEWKFLERRVTVESDLSNYATKADLTNATGVDTSQFAQKIDLVNKITTLDDHDKYITTQKFNKLASENFIEKSINKRFDKYSILNEAKYFYSGLLQIYLVFIPAKKYIKYFSGTTLIDS